MSCLKMSCRIIDINILYCFVLYKYQPIVLRKAHDNIKGTLVTHFTETQTKVSEIQKPLNLILYTLALENDKIVQQ